MKTVNLSAEAREVLLRANIEPLWVFLPTGKLDPAVYKSVDNFLKALGGKWNKSGQGHFFASGTTRVSEAISAGQATDLKKTFEQFFTPREVAEQMADLAGIDDGMLVLEPSAGAGALVDVALERGASVIAVELDSALMPILLAIADKWPGRVRRVCEDFLTWSRKLDAEPAFDAPIDCVLMNPPFGRCADIAHVSHALGMLRPGGTLVAVMSPHWTFAKDAPSERFRGMINDHSHDWTPLPEGSFRQSGTGVNTGLLTIRKGNI